MSCAFNLIQRAHDPVPYLTYGGRLCRDFSLTSLQPEGWPAPAPTTASWTYLLKMIKFFSSSSSSHGDILSVCVPEARCLTCLLKS